MDIMALEKMFVPCICQGVGAGGHRESVSIHLGDLYTQCDFNSQSPQKIIFHEPGSLVPNSSGTAALHHILIPRHMAAPQ